MTDQERRELAEALVRVTEERDALSAEHESTLTELFATRTELDDWKTLERLSREERDAARAERDEFVSALRQANDNRAGMLARYGIVRAERDEARDEVDRKFIEIEQLTEERNGLRDEVVRLGRKVDALQEQIVDVVNENATMRESASQTSTVLHRLFDERQSARGKVAALTREVDRLRTIIGELGAAEAAEPPEGIEALRPEDST